MADDIIHYVTLMANHISRMRTFPYLDGVHNVVMCLLFREGDKENHFSRKHVFGSWFLSILMCFSGSVVSNFLAGEPVSTPFKYLENVILASAIWYLVNYCPKDMAYRFFRLPVVDVAVSCIWSIYLVNKIQSGVSYGVKHFPDAYIIATVLGLAKGCGDRYLIALIKLIKGTFKESDNPFLFMPEQAKCSLVSSVFFVLSHYYQLPAYNQPFVFMGSLLLFIHTTVTRAAFGGNGIFSPVEHLVCNLLFSGGPKEGHALVQLPPESEEKTFYSPISHSRSRRDNDEADYDEVEELDQMNFS